MRLVILKIGDFVRPGRLIISMSSSHPQLIFNLSSIVQYVISISSQLVSQQTQTLEVPNLEEFMSQKINSVEQSPTLSPRHGHQLIFQVLFVASMFSAPYQTFSA